MDMLQRVAQTAQTWARVGSRAWQSVTERLVERVADGLGERLAPAPDFQLHEAGPDLAQAVEMARREWELARAYFDTVTEPELVEQAAHRIKAAERQYVYLLRKAREERLAQ